MSSPSPRTRLHVAAFERRERLASGLPVDLPTLSQILPTEITLHLLTLRCAVRRRTLLGAVLALLLALAVGIGALLLLREQQHGAPAAGGGVCSVMCGTSAILEAVGGRHLLADSKTFVDMPLAMEPADILLAWHAAYPGGAAAATDDELRAFVSANFLPAGSDTEPHVPSDYDPSPPALRSLTNASLVVFAQMICDNFVQLSRRTKESVRAFPQRYTLLHSPFPLLVPGGRFLESYAWDSFWIVEGLQLCGMHETARGVVLNLVYLLEQHGFVPNGGRAYYVADGGRSQPPLLSAMVRALYSSESDNVTLLVGVYPALLREYAFWMSGRHAVRISSTAAAPPAVEVADGAAAAAGLPAQQPHVLNRYATVQVHPRPESYAEDVATAAAAGYASAAAPGARRLFAEIAAAAESGLDFTARWFAEEEAGAASGLSTCATSTIVPCELNAMLHGVEANLAYFARELSRAHAEAGCGDGGGNGELSDGAAAASQPLCAALDALQQRGGASAALDEDASAFEAARRRRAAAIEELMWDEAAGLWRDLRLARGGSAEAAADAGAVLAAGRDIHHTRMPRGAASLTSYAPLMWPAFAPNATRTARVLASLLASGLLQPGGVLTTTHTSHDAQQWDAPNGWSPLVHALVDGLLTTGAPEAHALAREVARRWCLSALVAYYDDGLMHEKMDVRAVGMAGSGGEYAPQSGFGWTNGVVLDFLAHFDFDHLEDLDHERAPLRPAGIAATSSDV